MDVTSDIYQPIPARDNAALADDAVYGAADFPFGTDERRMQVRAYSFWTALAGDSKFPAIDDLDIDTLPDFGDCALLFDCTTGFDNPALVYLGEALRRAGAVDADAEMLGDIAPDTLVARLADHMPTLISNEAPVGFEAEFVNAEAMAIMYRGILLPFSSDDDTIDFVLGVMSWKEKGAADPQVTPAVTIAPPKYGRDEDAASELYASDLYASAENVADGPAVVAAVEAAYAVHDDPVPRPEAAKGADVRAPTTITLRSMKGKRRSPAGAQDPAMRDAPAPRSFAEIAAEVRAGQEAALAAHSQDLRLCPVEELLEEPQATEAAPAPALALDAAPDATSAPQIAREGPLSGWLTLARQYEKQRMEAESAYHAALHRAIGQLYDVALIARRYPDDYAAMLRQAGLAEPAAEDAAEDAAPAVETLVRLALGADADPSKVADCCAVVAHAFAQDIAFGALPAYLDQIDGGVRAIVGDAATPRPFADPAAARALLDQNPPLGALEFCADGSDFVILLTRKPAA